MNDTYMFLLPAIAYVRDKYDINVQVAGKLVRKLPLIIREDDEREVYRQSDLDTINIEEIDRLVIESLSDHAKTSLIVALDKTLNVTFEQDSAALMKARIAVFHTIYSRTDS